MTANLQAGRWRHETGADGKWFVIKGVPGPVEIPGAEGKLTAWVLLT